MLLTIKIYNFNNMAGTSSNMNRLGKCHKIFKHFANYKTFGQSFCVEGMGHPQVFFLYQESIIT